MITGAVFIFGRIESHSTPGNTGVCDLTHFLVAAVWTHRVDPRDQLPPAYLVDNNLVVLSAGNTLDKPALVG